MISLAEIVTRMRVAPGDLNAAAFNLEVAFHRFDEADFLGSMTRLNGALAHANRLFQEATKRNLWDPEPIELPDLTA